MRTLILLPGFLAMMSVAAAQTTRPESPTPTPSADESKPATNAVPEVYALTGQFDRVVLLRFKYQADLLDGLERMVKEQKIRNAGTAPLNLIYVAHGERMQDVSPEGRRLYASVDTGFIGQNVYLFCASEGLATVFRGAVDTDKLGRTMQLGKDQFVTFAQTVGYPRI